jgi:hypothetical protein
MTVRKLQYKPSGGGGGGGAGGISSSSSNWEIKSHAVFFKKLYTMHISSCQIKPTIMHNFHKLYVY